MRSFTPLILTAAVQEPAEAGYGGVAIESIAVRAGVGKSDDLLYTRSSKVPNAIRGCTSFTIATRPSARQAIVDLIACGILGGEIRGGTDPELATWCNLLPTTDDEQPVQP